MAMCKRLAMLLAVVIATLGIGTLAGCSASGRAETDDRDVYAREREVQVEGEIEADDDSVEYEGEVED
jgi:uncharacterized lipoprotein